MEVQDVQDVIGYPHTVADSTEIYNATNQIRQSVTGFDISTNHA